MKSVLATTLAAGLLAVSSFAFAADNNGGKSEPDGGSARDPMTTGDINNPETGTIDDATKCREGTSGGAPCQEDGTVMPQ